jgi:hypothetical protein
LSRIGGDDTNTQMIQFTQPIPIGGVVVVCEAPTSGEGCLIPRVLVVGNSPPGW